MIRAATGAPVCLTVTLLDALVLARSGFEHSVNFRSVMVFGRAEAMTDPAAKTRHLKVMMDQLFPGRWQALRPMTAPELPESLPTPDHVTGLRYARPPR